MVMVRKRVKKKVQKKAQPYGRADSMAEAVLKATAAEVGHQPMQAVAATPQDVQPPAAAAPLAQHTMQPAAVPQPPDLAQAKRQPAAAMQPPALVPLKKRRTSAPQPAVEPPQPEESKAATELGPAPARKPKRAGHSMYMKFWRSLQGKAVPATVTETYSKLKGRRGGLTNLFEDWVQCGGVWGRSALVARMVRQHNEMARGRFKLFDRQGLLVKYHGNTELVDQLIARKRADKEVWKDRNFPERQDLEQYRCWDSDSWDKEDVSREETDLEMRANVRAGEVKTLLKSDMFSVAEPVYNKPVKKNRGASSSTPTGTPTPSTPGSDGVPDAVKAMRSLRQQATKHVKDIGSKCIDAASWETKLRQANVPESMVIALAAAGKEWQQKFEVAKKDIETATINAVNGGDIAELEAALEESTTLQKNFVDQSATTKRLLQPVKTKTRSA